LQLVLLIGLPASIGLLMLAEPMLSTLFLSDKFTTHDVHLAGESLMAYSMGLLGFILVKVLVPGFSSRKDTKTPVRFGIYAMITNMGLNIILAFPFAHTGLALATSLSAFFNASLLLGKLIKDKIFTPGKNWANFSVKIIFANEVMALFLYIGVDTNQWFEWSEFDRAFNLALWIFLAGLVYLFALLLIGVRPNNFINK
jgi:putative peptidoglycan lipid II flippase